MGRLDYVLTDEDYVAFNQHAYRSSPGLVAHMRRQRIALGVAVPILFLVIGVGLGDPLYFLVFGVLIAAALWFAWPWIMQRSIDAQLGQASKTGSLARTGPVVLTWDEQRVYENFVGLGSYTDWGRMQRVEESAAHVFLLVGEMDAIIVPKRAGAGVAQLVVETRGHVPKHD